MKNGWTGLLTESETGFRKQRPNQGQTVSHLRPQNKMTYRIITALMSSALKINILASTLPQHSCLKNVFSLV